MPARDYVHTPTNIAPRKRLTGKRLLRAGAWLLSIAVLAASALVAGLTYPGTPGAGSSMVFQGYTLLPAHRMLSVLDYITIEGSSLFVTSESEGSVYKVHLTAAGIPGKADLSVMPGAGAAHGVVIDPVSHAASVTRSDANTVDIFDPERLVLIKHIPVADDPDGIFYDPLDKLIYLASGDSGMGTLIDPATQDTVASIALGGKPEFAVFDAHTGLMFQNLESTDSVLALDLGKRVIAGRWPLADCQAPTAMALDAQHRRLFIGCSGNARLVVFDPDSHRVLTSIPVGSGPDAIAYDAVLHRVYVTGKAGVLSVLEQDTPNQYRILDSIHTHYGAHTLALDPATHKVYVGYAGLFVQPRLAVFAPRP